MSVVTACSLRLRSLVSLDLGSRTWAWYRGETCRRKARLAPTLRNWESSHSVEYARFLTFFSTLRNATPLRVPSRFIPWICDAAVLSSICERAPTYFRGDPNHARARGTNFRENGDGYFRGENIENISGRRWCGALWILRRCMMHSLVTRSRHFWYTERPRYPNTVPLERKFLTYNKHDRNLEILSRARTVNSKLT